MVLDKFSILQTNLQPCRICCEIYTEPTSQHRRLKQRDKNDVVMSKRHEAKEIKNSWNMKEGFLRIENASI